MVPITPLLPPSSFRRSGASNEPSTVPIGLPVRAPGAKMLGQTHKQTHRNTDKLFFGDPPEEIFDHNTFNAKALKPLLSTILN